MKRTKKCAFCGKEFTANSGSQRYCCEICAEKAKRQKNARQRDFLKATEPIMDIQGAEYLSFSKAAILMGCSRQYIYKLVAEQKLQASRISSRMSFIRRADIEAMLAGNPYHRVLIGSRQKGEKKSNATTTNKKKSSFPSSSKATPSNDEVPDYISGEDVMSIYKVKRSWLYVTAKRNQIPVCRIAGKNYYSRKHLDDLFRLDLTNSDDYYTVEQVQQLYGYTKANIHHIVKFNNIGKVKVGVKNLLLKTDVDRVMTAKIANSQHS